MKVITLILQIKGKLVVQDVIIQYFDTLLSIKHQCYCSFFKTSVIFSKV
jgi:hypothetical protein